MATALYAILFIVCALLKCTSAKSLITVQSALTEIWETSSGSSAFDSLTGYTVVIQAQRDVFSFNQWTLAASDTIDLRVDSRDMDIIVQEKEGLFRQTLDKGRPKSFALNAMGRFSFFVPLLSNGSNLLPPDLLVKIKDDEDWTIAHINHDTFHLLSNVNSDTLIALNPQLSSSSSHATSTFIRRLISRFVRSRSANDNLEQSDTFIKREEKQASYYDPISNTLPRNRDGHTYAPFKKIDGSSWTVTFEKSGNVTFDDFTSEIFKRSTSNNTSMIPLDVLSNKADENADSNSVKLVSHKGSLMAQLRQANHNILHSIVESLEHCMLALYVTLARIGIRLRNLLDKIRNIFHWQSVVRTHRFMNHFFKIIGPAQQEGLALANDMVDQGIQTLMNETELSFDAFLIKGGTSFSDLSGAIKETQSKQDANLINDAKTHYLIDRILENVPNSDLMKPSFVQKHETEFEKLSAELSSDLSKHLKPEAHSAINRNVTAFFQQGSMILNQPLDKIIKVLHNTVSWLDKSTEGLFGVLDKVMGKVMTLVMKLLDTPIYIPFVSNYWQNVIAPGSGHISVLHLFTFMGSCQATWMYKLYRFGQEPFTDNDVEVHETVQNPQLILYTWKTHPLTSSNDSEVEHKRMAIFDWIPRMCAATFLTVTKMVQMVIPSTFELTHKFVKFTRYVSTYLINSWFFPVKQAEGNTKAAIQKAVNDVDPVIFTWWYGYVIGLSIRFLQPISGSISSIVERTGLAIAGSIQGLAVGTLLKRAHRTRAKYNKHQQLIIQISAVAWIMDTLDFFTGYIPGPMGVVISRSIAVTMVAAYDLRAHLMMALDVVGVLYPPPRDPSKNGRRIFA